MFLIKMTLKELQDEFNYKIQLGVKVYRLA